MLQETIVKSQDFPIKFPLRELSWGQTEQEEVYLLVLRMALHKTGSRAKSREPCIRHRKLLAFSNLFGKNGLKDI